MSRSIYIFLALICLLIPAQSYIESGRNCSKNNEVVQFISLFRHGDRTPTKRFRFESLRWPWDEGVLTIDGMMRAFRLGQKFKQMISLNNLSSENVKVYSDVSARTIDTANSLLLGLFLDWEEIPHKNLTACKKCRPWNGLRASPACLAQCMNITNSRLPKIPGIDLNQNVVTAIQQKDNCKAFKEWVKLLEKTPGYKHARHVSFKTALETVRKLNGGEKKLCQIGGKCYKIDLEMMEEVWSNLQCAISAGQTYVQGHSNEEFFEILNPVAEYQWRSLYPISQGTITGGILLNYIVDILTETKKKILENKTISERVVFFSGHDHTVFSLLSAMGGVDGAHLAEFCAHVTFTVTQINCQIILEVRYDVELFGVLGCPYGECMLDSFLDAMKSKVMPVQGCDYHATLEE